MTDITTLADIAKATPSPIRPWIAERFTAGGVFGVTVNVLGIITNYFLAGPVGSPAAVIIGRTESAPRGRQNFYIGGRLKGGTLVNSQDFYDAISQYDGVGVSAA